MPPKKVSNFRTAQKSKSFSATHIKPIQSIPILKTSHFRPLHKNQVNFDPPHKDQVNFDPQTKIKSISIPRTKPS